MATPGSAPEVPRARGPARAAWPVATPGSAAEVPRFARWRLPARSGPWRLWGQVLRIASGWRCLHWGSSPFTSSPRSRIRDARGEDVDPAGLAQSSGPSKPEPPRQPSESQSKRSEMLPKVTEGSNWGRSPAPDCPPGATGTRSSPKRMREAFWDARRDDRSAAERAPSSVPGLGLLGPTGSGEPPSRSTPRPRASLRAFLRSVRAARLRPSSRGCAAGTRAGGSRT